MADGFGDSRPRTGISDSGETASPEKFLSAEQLRRLLRAQSAVVTELELPAVLRRVVVAARELAGARYAALGMIGDDGAFTEFVHSGTDAGTIERMGDLRAHPATDGFLGVPIRIRDRRLATLCLTDSARGRFSAADEQLVVSLAGTAAVAIDNAGFRRESARTDRWSAAVTELTRRLLTDDGDHLDLVVRYARDIADADFATLALLAGPDRLEVRAAIGPMTEDLAGVTMGLRGNLAGQVTQTRTPVLTTVPTDHTAATVLPIRAGSVVVVPLTAGGTVKGTLNLGRIRGAPAFTDTDVTRLAGFAGRVGIAMELGDARAGRPDDWDLDHEQLGTELNEHVIKELFAVGLSLEGLLSITPEPGHRTRLVGCIDRLDDAVKRIRAAVFNVTITDDRCDDLHARLLTLVDVHTPALGHPVGIQFTRRSDQPLPPVLADDVVTVVRDSMTDLARHGSTRHVELHVDIAADLVLVEIISDGGNHLIWTAPTTDGAR